MHALPAAATATAQFQPELSSAIDMPVDNAEKRKSREAAARCASAAALLRNQSAEAREHRPRAFAPRARQRAAEKSVHSAVLHSAHQQRDGRGALKWRASSQKRPAPQPSPAAQESPFEVVDEIREEDRTPEVLAALSATFSQFPSGASF